MLLRTTFVLLTVASLVAVSCSEPFELPDPPDTDRLNDAYERPTARIDGDTAGELIERYLVERRRLDAVEDFRVVTDPVDEFTKAINESDDGVAIGDSPVDVDGRTQLSGDCPGWSETDEQGRFDLRFIIDESHLVPIGWGEVDECRGERTVDNEARRYLMTGSISVYAHGLESVENTDKNTMLVAFDLIRYIVHEEPPRSWTGSFRRTEDRIEMLLENDVGASVILFGGLDGQTVGIRAANGTWQCDLEEQICEAEDSSDSSLSY